MATLIEKLAKAQQLKENLQKAFDELNDHWQTSDHHLVESFLEEDYPFKEDFNDLTYEVRIWAGMPRE